MASDQDDIIADGVKLGLAAAVCLMTLLYFMAYIAPPIPDEIKIYKEKYEAQLVITNDVKADHVKCQRDYSILDAEHTLYLKTLGLAPTIDEGTK